MDDGHTDEWSSTNRQRFDSVDEEFGQLSVGRVKSAAGEDGEENNFFNEKPRGSAKAPEGNLFEADFSNVQELQPDEVQTGDLLNMTGTTTNVSSTTNEVNLLDASAPEPSTLELLTGAADFQNKANSANSGLLGDTFDPFSNLTDQSKTTTNQNAFDLLGANQPSAAAQTKPSNFDAFDLLGGSSTNASNKSQDKNKGVSSDEFMSFMDSKPANAQNSSKGENNLLNFGGMSLNINATSPGFGGSNPNLSVGGMAQQQARGFDKQSSPMGQKDPFADFGM